MQNAYFINTSDTSDVNKICALTEIRGKKTCHKIKLESDIRIKIFLMGQIVHINFFVGHKKDGAKGAKMCSVSLYLEIMHSH